MVLKNDDNDVVLDDSRHLSRVYLSRQTESSPRLQRSTALREEVRISAQFRFPEFAGSTVTEVAWA
jgi:hypothetical protein